MLEDFVKMRSFGLARILALCFALSTAAALPDSDDDLHFWLHARAANKNGSTPLYKNPDLESENTTRFCIGPTVHREFWRAGRHALNIDRGPCK